MNSEHASKNCVLMRYNRNVSVYWRLKLGNGGRGGTGEEYRTEALTDYLPLQSYKTIRCNDKRAPLEQQTYCYRFLIG